MTKTQLLHGIELNNQIESFEKLRNYLKAAFDRIHASTEEIQIIEIASSPFPSEKHEFKKDELLSLFDSRIQKIDFELETLYTKFKIL